MNERERIEAHRARHAGEYQQAVEPPLHPNSCGPCVDCVEALADYAAIRYTRKLRALPEAPVPTLAQLIRHARALGAACVFETAQHFLSPGELARLRTELDGLEANRRGRTGVKVGKPRRVPELERAEQVRLLAAEGLTSSEIAAKLGVTSRRVDRLLRVARNGHDQARATASLANSIRAHKTAAQRGVKSGVSDTPDSRVTARPTIPVQLERYVDARELAELMGVSRVDDQALVAAGMPSETWGMSRTRRFLPSRGDGVGARAGIRCVNPGIATATPPGTDNRRSSFDAHSTSVWPLAHPRPPPAHRQAAVRPRRDRRPRHLRDRGGRRRRRGRGAPPAAHRTPASASPSASSGTTGRPTRSGCARPSRRTSTTASGRRKFVADARRPAAPRDRRRARRRLAQGRTQPRHRPGAARVLQRRRQRPGGPARRPQPVREARAPRRAAAAATRSRRRRSRSPASSRSPTS